MNGEDRIRQPWGPRLLAPLAFFAAATILVVLVHSALNGGSEAATQPDPVAETAPEGNGPDGNGDGGGGGNDGGEERQFYRIRSGDTLEAIASRFETTVDDLLELNPNIQPNNLAPGQRIRVR